MYSLSQSIVIYRCQNCELSAKEESEIPRVWLSSGTQLAVDNVPDRLQYCQGAFMPKAPWREPTPAESALLWTDEPPPHYAGVGIVRLPADVLALLADAAIASLTTPLEVAEFKSQEKCAQILDRLIDYFQPFCLSEAPPVINCTGRGLYCTD